MGYFAELKTGWRALLAATLGLSSGFSATMYVTSSLAPNMVKDMGWEQAAFTAVGALAIGTAIAIPFAGRLADVWGVKRTALIGMVALPLIYLAYSMINSSLTEYVVIFIVQSVLCVTTTASVYSRLAVQYFQKMRGLALAIVASGPALAGVILAPLLNHFVDASGWRAAFQAVAVFTAIVGVIVFFLIPPERKSEGQIVRTKRRARDDYPMIFRSTAFWLLAGSMLFINLPQVIALTQLRFVIEAQNVTANDIGILFSTFAIGTLVGRFIAGIALDRLAPHIVAFVSMALPASGLALLATDMDALPLLMLSIFGIGFTFGAEGDVVAYLVSKTFPVTIFSSVMGLMTMMMSLSVSVGTIILSQMQKADMGYDPFLYFCAIAVFVGSLLFLPLGNRIGRVETQT